MKNSLGISGVFYTPIQCTNSSIDTLLKGEFIPGSKVYYKLLSSNDTSRCPSWGIWLETISRKFFSSIKPSSAQDCITFLMDVRLFSRMHRAALLSASFWYVPDASPDDTDRSCTSSSFVLSPCTSRMSSVPFLTIHPCPTHHSLNYSNS